MKQKMFDVEEDFNYKPSNDEEMERMDPPPKTINDLKKIEFIMNANRTHIDFDKEISSILNHEEMFTRPRLLQLMNNIYIPKFKVKSFSAYLYGGETSDNYN